MSFAIRIAVLPALMLIGCIQPLRLDPAREHQERLQQQQDECLRRGGTPQQCRP
jgi:hypothetical protein